jgi:hypothetical protein
MLAREPDVESSREHGPRCEVTWGIPRGKRIRAAMWSDVELYKESSATTETNMRTERQETHDIRQMLLRNMS